MPLSTVTRAQQRRAFDAAQAEKAARAAEERQRAEEERAAREAEEVKRRRNATELKALPMPVSIFGGAPGPEAVRSQKDLTLPVSPRLATATRSYTRRAGMRV